MVDVTISSAAAAPYLDVRLYGADPALADNAVAEQAAFDGVPEDVAADWASRGVKWGASEIVFPAGIFKAGTLNYRGQSIQGAGMYATVLLGLPSQDVLHLDPTLGEADVAGTHWRDFTIRVDDSVDAHTSFPQRGGVGNAGFAVDFASGSGAVPLMMSMADITDVQFESVSSTVGGQNASCGIYTQSNTFNLSRFRNVKFYRLAYGLWDDYPTSNLASVELYRDHNHFDALYFNGNGHAWRMVNNGYGQIDNLIMHSNTNGLEIKAVTSQVRARTYNMSFSNVFIEDSDVSFVCPYDATNGANYLSLDNVWIAGSSAETVVTLGFNDSTVNGLFITTKEGGSPTLTMTGSRNTLTSTRLQSVAPSTTNYLDSGTGNTVSDNNPTGFTFSYVEQTSPVTCSGGSEAGASAIVVAGTVTFDGATTVDIEFQSVSAGGAQYNTLTLYDGGSSVGLIGHIETIAAPVRICRRLTPSAGAHTYSVNGYKGGSGTFVVDGGPGGVGHTMPTFIRITKV